MTFWNFRFFGATLGVLLLQTISLYAQGALPTTVEDQDGLPMIWFIVYGACFVGIIYFMIIRPQQVQRKQQEDLVGAAKIGDRCTLNSGILGSIANVKKDTFMVKIADGVKIEVLKTAIMQVSRKDGDSSEPEAEEESEERDEEPSVESASESIEEKPKTIPKKSRRRR